MAAITCEEDYNITILGKDINMVALIFNSEQPDAVSVIISQDGNFICEEDLGEIARETMLIWLKLQRWHHLDLFRRTLYWKLRLFLYVLY